MTVAAVSSTTFPARLLGNGVSTVFNVAWKILAKTDLHVYVGTALKTVDIDYTVSGFGSDAGGTVTFTTAPGNGVSVVILRARSVTRSTDYQAHGDFLESTVDPDFDNPVLLIQDLAQQLQRAFVLPESDPVSAYPDWSALLSLANRKGKYFGFFNATTGMPELYQSLGSTVISQSIIAALLNPQTAAEALAGVVPTDFSVPSHIQLGYINPARYGFATTASAATNLAALDAAQDVIGQLGGGTIVLSAGTFALAATFVIDTDRLWLVGQGPLATKFNFVPVANDICIHATKGASSWVQGGIKMIGFTSADATFIKTAIEVDDGRTFEVSDIGISQGGWLNNGSIGLYVKGRDFGKIHRLTIGCPRPVIFGVNANAVTLNMDHFDCHDWQLVTTVSTGKCVDVETGANFSNTKFSKQSWNKGKNGFAWIDTTSTVASYMLTFEDCRREQSEDPTAFSMEITSTVHRMQQIAFRDVYFDTFQKGLKLRQADRITIEDCEFTCSAGIVAMDITFDASTELSVRSTFTQQNCTVVFTNGMLIFAPGKVSSLAPIPSTAEYRYDFAGTIISQFETLAYGNQDWEFNGDLAAAGVMSIPVRSSDGLKAAKISTAGYSATGPIAEGGDVVFTPAGSKLVAGTANFASTNVAGKLCVFDGGGGNCQVLNNTAQSLRLTIRSHSAF